MASGFNLEFFLLPSEPPFPAFGFHGQFHLPQRAGWVGFRVPRVPFVRLRRGLVEGSLYSLVLWWRCQGAPVIDLAKRDGTVHHDVSIRIKRIRINHHRRVAVLRIGFVAEMDALSGPTDRQLDRYFCEKLIAAGITPQHEVARSDVRVRDFAIRLDSRVTPKHSPPFSQRTIRLRRRPCSNFFVQCLPGRSYHDEAVHEGVVNWALQAVALGEFTCGRRKWRNVFSLPAVLAQVRRPRAVRRHARCRQRLIVETHRYCTGVLQRTQSGRHRTRNRRDVLPDRLYRIARMDDPRVLSNVRRAHRRSPRAFCCNEASMW